MHSDWLITTIRTDNFEAWYRRVFSDYSHSSYEVYRTDNNAWAVEAANFISSGKYYQFKPKMLVSSTKVSQDMSKSFVDTDKPLNVFESTDLEQIWSGVGLPNKYEKISIWRPVPKTGYFAVGDIATASKGHPGVGYLVKPKFIFDNSVQSPYSFKLLWSTEGSKASKPVFIWFPQCSPNFSALGAVASNSRKIPALGSVYCVRSIFTLQLKDAGWDSIWDTNGMQTDFPLSIWKPRHSSAYQSISSFFALNAHNGFKRTPAVGSFLRHDSLNFIAEKPVKNALLSNVVYHFDRQSRKANPVELSVTTIVNFASIPQTVTRSLEFTVTKSSSFTFGSSFEIGFGFSVSAGQGSKKLVRIV